MLIQSVNIPDSYIEYTSILPLNTKDSIGFLDIETMGLNRKKNPIILVGLMILNPTGGLMHQFFCEAPSEEKQMLTSFIEHLMPDIPLFTYNGRSFDIPYINQRLVLCDIPFRIAPGRCGDLLHWARQAFPELPRHNLKTIERHLGILRKDTLSGADCVEQYQRFLNTRDSALAQDICRHNYEDILYMAPLLQIYNLLPSSSPLKELPFTFETGSTVYWNESTLHRNGFLELHAGSEQQAPKRHIHYTGSASLEIKGHALDAVLPVVEFSYPEPGSLYLDVDRIPGLMPCTFNALPTEDKMKLLLRRGSRHVSANLSECFGRLLT